MLLTIIGFLVMLSLLVLVHELGHFLLAKRFGIRVEEFGFGLPPRIVGIKRGETVYSINWLPIGGFVKLFGEEEAELAGQKHRMLPGDAFFAKPKWQRSLVLLAGVVMNFLLAAVIFYLFLFLSNFKTELPLYFDHHFFAVNETKKTELIISNVAKNSPAEKAGIKPFSKVVAVNGQEMKSDKDFLDIINQNKGKTVALSLQDLNTLANYKVQAVPRVSPPPKEGSLGITFGPTDTAVLEFATPGQKLFSGATYSLNLLSYNLEVIGKLIVISFQERTVAPVGGAVSGPTGIYAVFEQILKIPNIRDKFLQTLNFIGLISISLAFFNVLPFPALDGGRLFFVGIEAVTRKRIKPEIERWANQVGMAVLLGLILLITLNDLRRLFGL